MKSSSDQELASDEFLHNEKKRKEKKNTKKTQE